MNIYIIVINNKGRLTKLLNKNIKIQFIAATELSCEHDGDSIHILAYLEKMKLTISQIYLIK